ncbi:hypothetical protein [Nocardia sp. CA-119907]|uniref:hypothetical protein n=1 Tax=Nocardia sp. CA-119907 TaxID=3239973 RepID=UPI003D954955
MPERSGPIDGVVDDVGLQPTALAVLAQRYLRRDAEGRIRETPGLPIEDSLESIFGSLRTSALLHQAGAGTGFSFSRLRPRGDVIASSGGIASGPVSFIELYDAASQVIRLGGRRRGANMAVLDVRHPDIEDFVMAKAEPGPLATFNLSVAVTAGQVLQRTDSSVAEHIDVGLRGTVAAPAPDREMCRVVHALE